MKIITMEWRSGADTVGIILTDDSMGKLRAYIGVGMGFNQEADARRIAEYGHRLRFSEAQAFFPHIQEKDYYTEG